MEHRPILRLRTRHAELARQLDSERSLRRPNELRVVRLKKLKLAIKDRISAMSCAGGSADRPALVHVEPVGGGRGSRSSGSRCLRVPTPARANPEASSTGLRS